MPQAGGGTTTTTGNGTTTTTTTDPATGSSTTTTSAADTTVQAALKSTAMVRTTLGTRKLKLKLKSQETVTLTAKPVRGGKTIDSKKAIVRKGTAELKVTIPSSATAGAAKLKLGLKDATGNRKSYTRTVHIRAAR